MKRIFLLIICVVFLLSATGCNSQNSDESSIYIPTKTDSEIADPSDSLPDLLCEETVFVLDGYFYVLPCDFSEFEKNGWEFVHGEDSNYYTNDYLETNESSSTLEIKKSDDSCKDTHVCVVFRNLHQGSADSPKIKSPVNECVVTTIGVGICLDEKANNAEAFLSDGFGCNSKATIDSIKSGHGDPDSENGGVMTPWWSNAEQLDVDYVEYHNFYAAISRDPSKYNYSIFSIWSNPLN